MVLKCLALLLVWLASVEAVWAGDGCSASSAADSLDVFCESCGESSGDCSAWSSSLGAYTVGSSSPTYVIPLVFHIILRDSTYGDIADSLIQKQVTILNDAYRARAGSHAENGFDTRIEFVLADEDTSGNSTTGIRRVTHAAWFDSLSTRNSHDSAAGDSLHWDPTRYYNVLTKEGFPPTSPSRSNWALWAWYAADNPQWYGARVEWYHVGDDDESKVLVHEIGHAYGLYHSERNFCSAECDSSGSTTGDLVPDTPLAPLGFGCSFSYSCSTPPEECTGEPIFGNNYMANNSDNVPDCWDSFTADQAARMRCALETYRPSLYLGIDGSSVQKTVNTFCHNGNDLFKLTLSWDTNIATDTATIELYAPTVACTSPTPTATKTWTSTSTSHTNFVQVPCSAGTWKYTIKSTKGNRTSVLDCQTVTIGCPSCNQCPPEGCDLD